MLLSVLLLLAQVDSKPLADDGSKVTLKVGEIAMVKKMTRVKCTTPGIVEAEIVDGRYIVKAQTPGATACTFQGTGAIKTIEYTVTK